MRRQAESSDESDTQSEDSYIEDDGSSEEDGGGAAAAAVPFKRKLMAGQGKRSGDRRDASDNESPISSDSEYDEYKLTGFNAELYKDDADRETLLHMPEKEREAILSERFQLKERLLEQYKLKQQLKDQKRAARGLPTSGSSRRAPVSSSSKMGKKPSTSRSSKAKQKEIPLPPTYGIKEIQAAQLLRHDCEVWLDRDKFAAWVQHCFVRVNVGENEPLYLLAEVHSVSQSPVSYSLYPSAGEEAKGNKVQCNIMLHCAIGKDQRPVKINKISNQPVNEEEFQKWVAYHQNKYLQFPSVESLESRRAGLLAARKTPETLEELERRVARNLKDGKVSIPVAQQRIEMQRKLQNAREEGDLLGVEVARQSLRALEEAHLKKASSMSEQTEKFLRINQKYQRRNLSKIDQPLKDGNAHAAHSQNDPFRRLPTRSAMMFSQQQQQQQPSQQQGKKGGSSENDNATAAAALKNSQQHDLIGGDMNDPLPEGTTQPGVSYLATYLGPVMMGDVIWQELKKQHNLGDFAAELQVAETWE